MNEILDNEQSGLWFEDAPSEATVAEIETVGASDAIQNPAPDWVQPRRNAKPKRPRKREWFDRAPNACKCYSYASTGEAPRRRSKRPEVGTDLCACQVKLAFYLEQQTGMPAAEHLKGLFLFGQVVSAHPPQLAPPTAEDIAHVEWVIEMNRDAWLAELAADVLTRPELKPYPYERFALRDQGMQPGPRRESHHTH